MVLKVSIWESTLMHNGDYYSKSTESFNTQGYYFDIQIDNR
jgi:hypothetical protein